MMDLSRQPRAAIEHHQLDRLRRLIAEVIPGNHFQTARLRTAGLAAGLSDLTEFSRRMPLTTKYEIAADQQAHPPYGSNVTFPLTRFTRLHQTSSTTGSPLRWLDTPGDWAWLLDGWKQVYAAAGVTAADRVFAAFSFGPFIGFWMAFEAALQIGCLTIPGGSMNSVTRLRAMLANDVTVLLCTPTYAIRLGEVAREEGIDLSRAAVRRIIVAGEPGGSIPAVRERLHALWPTARVVDHHGMTEVGPVTYECPDRPTTLHVMESHYLAEVIHPVTGEPITGEQHEGELVLTPLGRIGMPLFRYRTGDLVRLDERWRRGEPCACGRTLMTLTGGILGRADDMVFLRGVNLFPSAVDEIVHRFPDIQEYRVEIDSRGALDEMRILIEPASGVAAEGPDLCRRLAKAFRDTWNLRIDVVAVPAGQLPRFEMKARRWVRLAREPAAEGNRS